jgi:hypothetical protein
MRFDARFKVLPVSLFVLIAVALLAACGGGGSGSTPSTSAISTATTSSASSTPAPGATVDASTVVTMQNTTDLSDTTANTTLVDPIDDGTGALDYLRELASAIPGPVATTSPVTTVASASPSTSPTPFAHVGTALPVRTPPPSKTAAPVELSADPCISATPVPIVYGSDGVVPANENYTYSSCTRSLAGGATETLTGLVNITDTSANASTLSWTRTVTNMNDAVSGGSGPSYSELRNGQGFHTLTNGQTVETINRQFTVKATATAANGTAANQTITIAENIGFTAASGATIQPAHRPPDGTVTVSGTRTVVGSVGTASPTTTTYTISTLTPLTYDSTCQTLPRITAGVLQMVVTSGTATNTLTITFSGCGTSPTTVKS